MVEIDLQIEAALEKGRSARKSEPRAVKAWFDEAERKVAVELANGVIFSFPPEVAEGLAGASASDLRGVEVLGNGHALHWEALDADFSVPNLVNGLFGTSRWMAARAGSSKSSRKAAAARANGAKGGRPRKSHEIAAVRGLSAIVGSNPLPRAEIISRLWDHVRKNKLQNPRNKREILADDKLRMVFGKDRMTMFEMNKQLSKQLDDQSAQTGARNKSGEKHSGIAKKGHA